MSKMGNEYIRRREANLCLRCNRPRGDNIESNICGTCADDLMAEVDALVSHSQAEAEAEDYSRWLDEQNQ